MVGESFKQVGHKIQTELRYLSFPSLKLKSRMKTVRVENNRSKPAECLWFCSGDIITKEKPKVIFPKMDRCFMLAGHNGKNNFFGHFTPLTFNRVPSEEIFSFKNQPEVEKVVKEIEEEKDKVVGKKTVDIYYIKEAGHFPIELGIFLVFFEKSGYEVKIISIDRRLKDKTFAFDTEDKILKVVKNPGKTTLSGSNLGFFSKTLIQTVSE